LCPFRRRWHRPWTNERRTEYGFPYFPCSVVFPKPKSLPPKERTHPIKLELTGSGWSRGGAAAAIGITLLIGANTIAQTTAPVASDTTAVAEVERVIVTGSNIPTSEEVGPNSVDTYRPEDLQRLGVRTATDLTQKLPVVTGFAMNENMANGDGRTEVNLRGLFPKETLVLVDNKRVAPVGFALGASVNINLIPFPLVDHIDILKDGASAIYGSDAIGGVVNFILKHKFRGLELEVSYGNTNLGSSNDAGEREGYLLAGSGDDKTDIVVFAQFYDRAAIFSRDRGISSTGDFRRFGGTDNRSGLFAGRIGRFFVLRRRLRHTDSAFGAGSGIVLRLYTHFVRSIPLAGIQLCRA
jgi:outer membrane receptor protein involved in Fe transport